MSDPFDELKRMGSTGLPSTPLPAAEVRRRGDRMRRRRTVLSTAGAAVAVAVVASGGLFVGQNLTGGAPAPGPATQAPSPTRGSEAPRPTETTAPAPAGGWLTEIPAGFPIDQELFIGDGHQMTGPSESSSGVGQMVVCGSPAYPTEEPADRLAMTASSVEYGDARELTTYDTSTTAEDVAAAVEDAFTACPREDMGGTTHVREVRPHDLGDGGFVGLLKYEDEDLGHMIGLTQFWVVRVGNAVLVTAESSEADPWAPGALDDVIADRRRMMDPVVDAMCVFAADSCDDEGPDDGSGETGTEPELGEDNLVTADQLPKIEDRFVAPWESVEPQPVPTLACQAAWLDSLGQDEMVYREFRAGSAESSEDYPVAKVNTAVLAFGSTDEAETAYETVAGWVETCQDRLKKSPPLAYNEEKPVRPDLEDGQAVWRNVHFFAPEVCVECDAVWFDRQGVAVVEDRLVLVSFARLGGPLEPEGLDAAMQDVFDQVVEAGRA